MSIRGSLSPLAGDSTAFMLTLSTLQCKHEWPNYVRDHTYIGVGMLATELLDREFP